MSNDFQKVITGSFTAVSQALDITSPNQSTSLIQISGTWVGTLNVEGSNDGTTYYALLALNSSNYLPIASITADGLYVACTNGFQFVRVRSSAWTSGTANVSVYGSDAASLITSNALIRGGSDGTIIGNVTDRLKITSIPIADNGGAKPSQSMMVAGTDGTNIYPLLTDNQGRLVTSALTGFGAAFTFGDVTVASTALAAVRRTVYTEQTANAQRSLVSASALDTSAGTGARTVKITYLDQTGAGPFTETVTLNGVTPVNTVSTTICYIEKIEVVTAGSTGSNAGIISLKAATAGGGATIWTIGATENQTFGAHHYVPTGKICNITGISVSHSGTTVGSGAVFFLRWRPLNNAAAVESQASDSVRLYGQASTSTRNYGSPIKLAGPSRVFAYVTPETSTSTVYRASFDFFEP